MTERTAHIVRRTSESEVDLHLDLDGSGCSQIDTGVGFYDHMPVSYTHLTLPTILRV